MGGYVWKIYIIFKIYPIKMIDYFEKIYICCRNGQKRIRKEMGGDR